jgi:hypothetical protein
MSAAVEVHLPPDLEAAFDLVLERLVEEELSSMRLDELAGPPPSFAEVFDFYRGSGFLYAAKLAEMRERIHAIEATWRRLIAAGDDVFKLMVRRRAVNGEPEARNSVCAFEHTPGTWQCQHLVSAERHEYTGTLTTFLAMARWLERNPAARFTRLAFRPGNAGVARLFGDWQRAMPAGDASLSTYDYLAVPLDAVGVDPGARTPVRVMRATARDADALRRFYADSVPGPELDSLRLEDPDLLALSAKFDRHALERRRAVFMARAGERLVGAAICNVGACGTNFSFLESAVEGLEISPHTSESTRRAAFGALVGAAVAYQREHGRSRLIALLRPGYAAIARDHGLVGEPRKQYTVFTGRNSPEGFAATHDCFVRYYRLLLMLEAAGDRR